MNRLLIFILFILLLPIIQIKPININDYYENSISVQITGEVINQEVIEVKYGATINDLINKELIEITEKADLSTLNLNYVLSENDVINFSKLKTETEEPLISINNANIEQLCELNGVGIATANNIIAYRIKNGKFKTLEELLLISGIKEAKYNKIKDYICL
jgi:competence protein ComEA